MRNVGVTFGLGLLSLGLPATALAGVGCDEIMNMVTLNIPSTIVIETMRGSGGVAPADVACLQQRGAPADVVAAAQGMVAGAAPAPAPMPMPGNPPMPVPAAPAPSSTFDTEETLGGSTFGNAPTGTGDAGNDEVEPSGGGPAELEQAIEAYRAKKFATASNALYDMLRENKFPDQQTKIEYYLGKALYDLGMYHSAQHYFMTVVTKGPSNPYFKYALPRLVAIAQLTGNDYELLRVVAKIPPEAFPRQAKNHLYYLMGRKLFEKDELTGASEFFGQVSSKSDEYMRAKYYEGIINQQRGKLKSAVQSFREVMTAQPPIVGDAYQAQQIEDMKDLSLMNVARIYYNLQRFDNAENYYAQVDRDSTYWAESLFERAWTSFMRSDLNLALGLLLTVDSPYFADSEFVPEVTYLRGLTFFNLCEYDDVEATLKIFKERYQPMKDEVTSFVGQYREQKDLWDQAYDQYFENKHDQSALQQSLFARVLRNRDLGAMVRHLDMMDKEVELINAQKAQWKDNLGQELIKTIEEDRVRYKKKAGAELLKEMIKIEDMLSSLLTQGDIVEFEVTDAQRADYEFKAQTQDLTAGEERKIDFATSRDIIYWPFNGEFWRDELGYYRYTEHGSCR
jgi:tetratricopeptide (TPR) repeat protein